MHGSHQVRNRSVSSIFHLQGLTNLFLSSADDWSVIAKQHCVCAIVELQSEGLEKGLDAPQWFQIVKVNLLKTETSWSTRVAIAGRKQAIDLDIFAVRPSKVAGNFLMHLRVSPAGPEASARDRIHRTIQKAASGSAWIRPQISDYELQVCSCVECEASQPATWPRTLLLYSLMRLRRLELFFTWVYHAADAAVQSMINFEHMHTPVTMNPLKFLQNLYEPATRQGVTAHMSRPKVNIKGIQDRASIYLKQSWIDWHWGAAPDSVIHPSRSIFP